MKLPLLISNNLSLKIVSVVIASLFWLYVMAAKDTEKRVQVPVEIVNLDDSLTIVDKPPAALDVELRGDRLSLLTLSQVSLKLVLDMKNVKEGSVSFSNLEKSLVSNNRIRVTRVNPARIEITLARLDKENRKGK
jgi:YbbR domain-containing protein